jgi:hypothetical protein
MPPLSEFNPVRHIGTDTSESMGGKIRDCYGFECPHCGFHRLLVELAVSKEIHPLFAAPQSRLTLQCPECRNQHEYAGGDLKRFVDLKAA